MLRFAVAAVFVCQVVLGLDNGIGLTPPMGFLTWERFRCETDCVKHPNDCISEKLIMSMADAIVSTGMKDAGYEYVNIDDCWPAHDRDPKTGRLVPDPDRFPSGMKALADYVHSKGLKLGIYEDFGSHTCGGYPGSEFYMQLDAQTFADWGIDFLKFDGCNSDPADMPYGYPAMTKFLNMTGRRIMYNCQWPLYMSGHGLQPNFNDIRENCNLWRSYGDINDQWSSVTDIINFVAKNNDMLRSTTGPGGWNDPDMIIVGDYGLSYYQQMAQFGMWSLWSAPLLVSSDLRNLSDEAKAILLNKRVIAINQDPLGKMAKQVFAEQYNQTTVWVKEMALPSAGSFAVGFLNVWGGGNPVEINTTFKKLGLTNSNGYTCTDAWTGKPLGKFELTTPIDLFINVSNLLLWTCSPA